MDNKNMKIILFIFVIISISFGMLTSFKSQRTKIEPISQRFVFQNNDASNISVEDETNDGEAFITYKPASVIDTYISEIILSPLIAQKTGSMTVKVTNRHNKKGIVQITIDANKVGVIHNRRSLLVDNEAETIFHLTTPISATDNVKICIKVCSQGNQFSTESYCDEQCIYTSTYK